MIVRLNWFSKINHPAKGPFSNLLLHEGTTNGLGFLEVPRKQTVDSLFVWKGSKIESGWCGLWWSNAPMANP
jgi:hypothetical protein